MNRLSFFGALKKSKVSWTFPRWAQRHPLAGVHPEPHNIHRGDDVTHLVTTPHRRGVDALYQRKSSTRRHRVLPGQVSHIGVGVVTEVTLCGHRLQWHWGISLCKWKCDTSKITASGVWIVPLKFCKQYYFLLPYPMAVSESDLIGGRKCSGWKRLGDRDNLARPWKARVHAHYLRLSHGRTKVWFFH